MSGMFGRILHKKLTVRCHVGGPGGRLLATPGKTILASIETLLYLFEMETVTLSSKYQVVIPRSVRNRLGLRPGMKLQVIEYNGRVEFLPVRKPAELRGLLKGLEPVIEREPDRS